MDDPEDALELGVPSIDNQATATESGKLSQLNGGDTRDVQASLLEVFLRSNCWKETLLDKIVSTECGFSRMILPPRTVCLNRLIGLSCRRKKSG